MPRMDKVGTTHTTIGEYRTHGHTQIGVMYHATVVVRWDDATIHLSSGGWRTATTKNRMNQTSNQFGLGFHVWQRDFEWFVDYHNKTLPFTDGMVLDRLETFGGSKCKKEPTQ